MAACIWLFAGQALAQISGEHYLAGTEGIEAGSLPRPGVYTDSLNWFGDLSERNGNIDVVQNARILSFIDELRPRWITKQKLLSADYGLEAVIPLGYQDENLSQQLILPPFRNPILFGSYTFHYGQSELHDWEVSPLLLGWHWRRFDLTAGYAVWVPMGDDSAVFGPYPFDPNAYVPPAQYHWWEHIISLGGTWHPDEPHNWSLSILNHYEISEPFHSNLGSTDPGQLFTTEWGVSRTAGKYAELGLVGNYAAPVTTSRLSYGPLFLPSIYSSVEIGPEIKINVSKFDFSASLRYLRELNNPNGSAGDYDLNIVALTLSKRF